MTERFRASVGRRVVSRASAEVVGTATHLVVDAPQRRIAAVVVGKGRRARLVEWQHLTGFGPDAIMVSDDGAVREAANDWEREALDGKLELIGKRVLGELGTELGTVDDVLFDPETGMLVSLVVSDRDLPAGALLGSGSYAVVLAEAAAQGERAPLVG